MQKRDIHTLDLFDELPPAPVSTPGGLSCRAEIAHIMSDALKSHDRFEVAAKMSKLLGREISKHMLDAYTAESREDHIPPLDTAIAFDLAIGASALAELFSKKVGAKLVFGREALDARLGTVRTAAYRKCAVSMEKYATKPRTKLGHKLLQKDLNRLKSMQ